MPSLVVAVPYIAILGLLAALHTVRVILNRVRSGVNAGDGGDIGLTRAIRAHGNFVEQAPIALILIATAEITGARSLTITVLCLALLAARLASAMALSRSVDQSGLRQFSGGLSILVLVAASVAVLLALAGVK